MRGTGGGVGMGWAGGFVQRTGRRFHLKSLFLVVGGGGACGGTAGVRSPHGGRSRLPVWQLRYFLSR